MVRFLTASLLFFISSLPLNGWANDKPPVILELFTSQSCSSCPPADKVLGEWAKQDNVIALSCNVTYWNHLHWEDTLSREFCTQRQREYNATFGRNGIYTPQLVVNGTEQLVGSHGRKVDKVIRSAEKQNSVKAVSITRTDDDLSIVLPNLKRGDYTVTLFTHGTPHTQSIPSGENRGRTVNYTNPVQDYIALGNWNGTEKLITYQTDHLAPAHGYVVLVQERSSVGTIRAAGQVKL